MNAKRILFTDHNRKEISFPFRKEPCEPYVRRGSIVTAVRTAGQKKLVTILPAEKKGRGFQKPFTTVFSREEYQHFMSHQQLA